MTPISDKVEGASGRTSLRDAKQSIITENLNNTGDINFAYHNHVTYDSRYVSSVLDWLSQLSPINFTDKHLENLRIARKADGTGQWMLNREEFRRWRDKDDLRTLWCHGIPGAGKTILTSIVVNHLATQRADNGTCACLYVYFDHRDQKRQHMKNLLPNLLSQLVRARGEVSKEVNSIHETFKVKGMAPTTDEYLQVISSEIKSLHRVYIVVDALDECLHEAELNIREEFVRALGRLPQTTRLLFFSRHDQSIRLLVNPDDTISVVADKRELGIYVRSRIAGRTDLKKLIDDKSGVGQGNGGLKGILKGTVSFMDYVINTVVERSDGMFLLARLHMDFLASKLSIQDLESGIATLPETPDKVYQLALQRIADQNPSKHALAIGTMRWLVFAERALTVEELLGALIVNVGGTLNAFKPKGLVSEETLTSACAGLLVVDPSTRAIQLAHYTTREYMQMNSPAIFAAFGDPQSIISETCLLYLLHEEFQSLHEPSPAELEDRRKHHPFHSYAADHWGRHMAAINTDDKEHQQGLYKLARQFLYNAAAVNSAFKAMSDYRFKTEQDVSALHMAAYFGLDRLTRMLFKRGFPLNAVTKRGETALHWATFYKHSTVVDTLVACGASTDLRDHMGKTALHRAVMNQDTASLNALLKSGQVDLDVKDNEQWTPLRWAASYGHLAIAEKLLTHGANIDAQDKDGFTALRWANSRGHGNVVDLLIQRGASLENGGGNLLFWACRHGQLLLVRRLLEKRASSRSTRKHDKHHKHHQYGVYLDATDTHGWTPLRMAIEYGHGMVAWFLIQAGADVNKADESGWSPLHAAAAAAAATTSSMVNETNCSKSHNKTTTNLAWLLLESNANPHQTTKPGWTPLHVAASNGNSTLVWLFLETAHTLLSSKTKHGESPLHLASKAGHTPVVSLLLHHGADPKRELLNNGRTALHSAIEAHQTSIVRQLLQHTPSLIHSRDDEHETPLHTAATFASRSSLDIIRLLAAAQNTSKASSTSTDLLINAKDRSGNTPLHRAAAGEHGEVVTFLLEEMGADPNVMNRRRGTALHAAANTGNLEVVRRILDFGRGGAEGGNGKVDAGLRDKEGLTAWEVLRSLGCVVEEF